MVQLPPFPHFATLTHIVMPAAGGCRALPNDAPATVLGVISLDVARERVLGALQRLEPREISCADATGLVLANDVVAPENVPPFANTAVDGFAIRTDDLREVPCDLRVIGTLAAGDATEWTLNPGEALRIMTGAVMPLGADAVVMVEDAEVRSESTVRISKRVPVGAAVRPVADDVREGEVVFPSGTVVTPAGAGVLASVNAHRVMTYPRARVVVLSTGDELVTDGSPLRRGQIRESNLTMLEILLKNSECEVMNVGVVADDPTRLEQVLLRVANECDAIVTSGGVSMGDFDVVKMVLSRIADMQWMQLAIKPAKPFAFGLLSVAGRQVPVFGLPGNPVSSLISFELLARPALRHMMGHTHQLVRPSIRAIADVPLRRKPDGKVHFMRVIGHFAEDGRLHIRDAGPQGSHQLAATAAANGLAVVSDGEGVPAGHEVEVILIN